MKAVLRVILTLSAVLVLTANVWATPVSFTADVANSSVTLSDTAKWANMNGKLEIAPISFIVNDNDTQAMDFFSLNASGWGGGSYAVSAKLAFTSPSIISQGNGSGLFFTLGGIISGGTLTWIDMPKYFTLDDGNIIMIDFQDGWTIGLGDTAMVHAYVTNNGGATPAPEPATMLLLGLGLVGLAGVRRKFKK